MDLVTGALAMLPSKLTELAKDEYILQKGLKADVENLSKELRSTYAFLHEVADVPWDQLKEPVKVWASEVREASYDMEDLIDTFIISVSDGGGPEPADPDNMIQRLLKKMGKLFDLSKIKARHDIASSIQDIKKQVQEIHERHIRYNIDHIVTSHRHTAPAQVVDPRLSHNYKETSELVGIDEPREELIKMLSIVKGDDIPPDELKMKIVSVLGFGGWGKTTLANAVYDKIKHNFQCSASVPVGQNPDIKNVLKEIFIDIIKSKKENIIPGIDPGTLSTKQLIDEIREHLQGKRYLIVVDDIWETPTWDIIKNAFINECSGSRIITTTRISKVSKIGEVYRIPKLSVENSKELFRRKAFRGDKKRPCSAEVDGVSDKILQKCDGVPLAIVTIASVLARKQLNEWPSVYESIGFGHGDGHFENMKKILSFSYYDLPCHLRTCLLYLSTFLEECAIDRRDLILRWIAEGFIKEEKGDFLDIGDEYLDELIDRNIIIPIIEEKGSGLLSACHVHDMVLRLIRDLSSKENFIVVLNGEEQPPPQDNIRRLALQMLKVKTNYKDMPQLRSFSAIICGARLMPPVCSFKVLRVLVLEFCIGMEDYPLHDITKLLHLRYLGLSHTPARKLPKDIGRLKFLQTLVLEDTGIEELPVSVRQLTQLMCLRVDRKMSVPKWIGELTSLVELEMYHEVPDSIEDPFSVVGPEMYRGVGNKCSARQFAKALGKLTNLRVLKTGMNLKNQEQGREFLESLGNLQKVQQIISLPNGFLEMDVAVMESSFALSSSLCVLDLLNLEFSRLPAWINDHDLPNLCQLSVVLSLKDEQDLLVLGKLRGLRKLVLIIRVRILKLAVCGSDGFEKLISLIVTVPLKFAHGAMPRLEYIDFGIPVADLKDTGIGLEFGLENLSSLRSVHVDINCADACQMEVDDAEAVLKREVDSNPNRPALEVTRKDEDKMGPANAESRMENQQFYKILKASTLSDDIKVQQDRYNTLYNEAAEVARSMPKEHPCVAKLALLPQQLASDPVGSINHAFALWDSNQLIEEIEAQERLLEEYNIEIPRIATVLEELKIALRLQECRQRTTMRRPRYISDHATEEKGRVPHQPQRPIVKTEGDGEEQMLNISTISGV